MKTNRLTQWMPVVVIALIALLAVVSWIGNIFEMGLRNLLTADGIRWIVSRFVDNITAAPISEILLLLITLSVLRESGLIHAFNPKASLKQRRALTFSMAVTALIVITVLCLLFLPGGVLLSPFGELDNSPFLQGLFGLVCTSVIVIANVYGLTSGRFSQISEVLEGHTTLIVRCASAFITIVLIAQLIACLQFVGLWNADSPLFLFLSWILYLLPLIVTKL